MVQMRTHKNVVGRRKGRDHLGDKHRWEDNIKMILKRWYIGL